MENKVLKDKKDYKGYKENKAQEDKMEYNLPMNISYKLPNKYLKMKFIKLLKEELLKLIN